MSRRKVHQARRGWTPMARAEVVPLSADRIAAIEALGADTALLAELAAAEMWRNEHYLAVVTRREDGSVSELSIRRADRKAVHDWRDFQRIKSEVAGAEVEAFELYPAESRLMDTANQYMIWCLPPGETIPAGYMGPRNVMDANTVPGAVQRPLPEDWR